MPIYKIRLSKARAEKLQAKLRKHYHTGKALLPLAIQAAYDYLYFLDELATGNNDSRPNRPHGIFRRFMSKDT